MGDEGGQEAEASLETGIDERREGCGVGLGRVRTRLYLHVREAIAGEPKADATFTVSGQMVSNLEGNLAEGWIIKRLTHDGC